MPAGRPARPGRPARRSGPKAGPLLFIGLVVAALAGGAFFFWQSRHPGAPSEAVAITTAGPSATSASETSTPVASPTPTLPVVSSGAVPEARDPASAPAATEEPSPRPAPIVAQTTAAPTPANGAPDLAALAQRMLELVNADRQANGLRPVAWDATAALAGQTHSEDMAQFGYMSHWDMDGHGPEYRYSRAGGLDQSQENVYRFIYQWEDGRGAPIDDWEQVVADAEAALMNSPGHRANILAPAHTHLGVGIAYNPATGNVAIAQEFVNRYVSLEPMPKRAQPGDRLVLRGSLLPGSADPLVNLAYEPFPQPLTLEQLNKTSTYKSAAQHLSVPAVRTSAERRFVSEFTLDQEAPPGLYHVWVWVKSSDFTEPVQAVDAIIEVSQ